MFAGQLRQHGEQAARGTRRVDGGREHHERVVGGDGAHERGHSCPVHLDELRIDRGHARHHARQQLSSRGSLHAGAHSPVVDDHVDAVSRARGESGEQQCRLEGGVDPGLVVDTGGRRAAAVDDDHDPPVPFRPPGAHDEAGAGCRGPTSRSPPVDRTHVVAAHVVAQAVELCALATDHDARGAVEFAEPGQS